MKKTHAAVGLATAYAFGLDPVMVVAGAVLPDLDCVFQHRKLLHNVFVLVAAFAYNFAFGVGWFTHLLLDALTVAGVAVLWPASGYRLRLGGFRTGGLFDHVLFVGGLASWAFLNASTFL